MSDFDQTARCLLGILPLTGQASRKSPMTEVLRHWYHSLGTGEPVQSIQTTGMMKIAKAIARRTIVMAKNFQPSRLNGINVSLMMCHDTIIASPDATITEALPTVLPASLVIGRPKAHMPSIRGISRLIQTGRSIAPRYEKVL
jgi:hypothetical protein